MTNEEIKNRILMEMNDELTSDELRKHIECYKENIPIDKKSKEKYRQKLNIKREILERNNLSYFILFPPEITADNLEKIFNRYFYLEAS